MGTAIGEDIQGGGYRTGINSIANGIGVGRDASDMRGSYGPRIGSDVEGKFSKKLRYIIASIER